MEKDSNLYMLGNFHAVCWLFFKINLSKKFFQDHYQCVKQLGSRSGLTFCRSCSGFKLFAKFISRQQQSPLTRKESWSGPKLSMACSNLMSLCLKLNMFYWSCQWSFWRGKTDAHLHIWTLFELMTRIFLAIAWKKLWSNQWGSRGGSRGGSLEPPFETNYSIFMESFQKNQEKIKK